MFKAKELYDKMQKAISRDFQSGGIVDSNYDFKTNTPMPKAKPPKESESMRKKPFYLVWNPETGYVKYQHDSKESAEAEAERLAFMHKGQEFIVLCPLSSFKKIEIQKESFDYTDGDEIPF